MTDKQIEAYKLSRWVFDNVIVPEAVVSRLLTLSPQERKQLHENVTYIKQTIKDKRGS